MIKEQYRSRKGRFLSTIKCLASLAVFILVSCIFYFWLFPAYIQIYTKNTWCKTEATIINSKLIEFGKSDGIADFGYINEKSSPCGISIKYRYKINGHEYIGDRVSIDDSNGSYDKIKKLISKYKKGKKVKLFYNPKNPKQAALTLDVDLIKLIMFTVGYSIIILYSISLIKAYFLDIKYGVGWEERKYIKNKEDKKDFELEVYVITEPHDFAPAPVLVFATYDKNKTFKLDDESIKYAHLFDYIPSDKNGGFIASNRLAESLRKICSKQDILIEDIFLKSRHKTLKNYKFINVINKCSIIDYERSEVTYDDETILSISKLICNNDKNLNHSIFQEITSDDFLKNVPFFFISKELYLELKKINPTGMNISTPEETILT
jgi:hypothetical protein